MNGSLPEHPLDARLDPAGPRWVVILERRLQHPVEEVWSAVTDRARVATWAPFRPDRDLDATGPVTLSMIGSGQPEEPGDSTVAAVVPPSLLELNWGSDTLRLELAPDGDHGTRLTLRHTFDPRERASSLAAGWHLCLAALVAGLRGGPVPPVAGQAALAHGWERLEKGYRIFLLG